MLKSALVTVGTTEFDILIRTICSAEVVVLLEQLQISRLVIQFGRGETNPIDIWPESTSIELEAYPYKASLAADIADADIVIGHAGAGTCVECLEAGNLLVVVSNDQLHDQHQAQLAEQFARDKFLLHCVPDTLGATLSELIHNGSSTILPYQPGNPKLFADWLVKELFSDLTSH